MEEFREYVNCRLCGADDYNVVYEWPANYYNHSKFETVSWDGRKSISLKICKCKQCGLPYTNPSFKEDSLNLVYPTDLIPNFDNISSKENFLSLFQPSKYKRLLAQVERNLRKDSSILDIGTRYGGLPYYLKKHDYKAFGLELNENSVSLANKFGLDFIKKGKINDIGKYAGKELPEYLDCVIMDDVLEHMVEPLKGILEIAKFQKKSGKIIMRQMNWNSLGHKLYGKNWYYLQPAAHMSYFTPQTAKVLLKKCGYQNINVFQTSFLKNAKKTFTKTVKNKLFGKKEWVVKNTKTMYLQKRNKAFDDMFTVVGEKS